ncbi:hypothetical protein [Marinospirillum sp.]|uniref:hypothetical protein n=1 Tax=Marinospirillum sp. TaxID=2183934 RepID=UPI003A83E904
MRIENAYNHSLEAQESLNTSLNSAQGAQFSLMLSLMMAPVYSPDLSDIYSNMAINSPQAVYPTHIPTRFDPPELSQYAGAPAVYRDLRLVEDTYARQMARRIQGDMGIALVHGNAGYFSWLRALTEQYPKLQFVTTLKAATGPSPHQVAAAYAAQAKPDTATLIKEINSSLTVAA